MNDLEIGFNDQGQKVITIGNDYYLVEDEVAKSLSICDIIERSFKMPSCSIVDEGEGCTVIENTVIVCRCTIKINDLEIEQETSFDAFSADFDEGDRLDTRSAFFKAKKYAVSRLLM